MYIYITSLALYAHTPFKLYSLQISEKPSKQKDGLHFPLFRDSETTTSMAKKSSKAKIAKWGILSKKQENKQIHKVACGSSKKAARRPERLKPSPSQKSLLLEKANDIADQLPLKYPNFVKVMLPSHVSGGFWLGLPARFCQKHMESSDQDITLEDEDGEKFTTKYLAGKMGLSAGWRGFSLKHRLVQGYVLVFHKVETQKFKVYICKPNTTKQVKFAADVSQTAVNDTQMAVDTQTTAFNSPTSSELSEDLLYIMGDHDEGSTEGGDVSSYIDGFEDNSDCVLLERPGLPESAATPFKEVTCFDTFKVMFNGRNINSQIPKVVLKKYYELCSSQSSHLHQHVVESLNSHLVVGLITETVNIADAVKSCKITTKECEFQTWEKTLEASEILGMNVGFLRIRVRRLASLAAESLQVAASFKKVTNVPW
uniref:B3 domain-containing protein Os01g0234100-like isoform X1 n=2 Tax=Fragaria vesca subsp. vesca TaxID=101020 RepID=UPI0005CB58D6|nr:PREDICTED: B3 domain-containing protein Os01g0234100-like isoform X1 [Fragaria vesca subsp. vesca]